MFETMEKELEIQFTDLLSIMNGDEEINLNNSTNHSSNSNEDNLLNSSHKSFYKTNEIDEENLDAINLRLSDELNEQLLSIEQVREELDEELRKRDSLIIDFDKLDKNGSSSNEDLMDFNDTTDSLFQKKNNCETIEEQDENTPSEEIDDRFKNLNNLLNSSTDHNYFNLSRTNLNSVLEEDENEDSQNDDLIELNDINLNEINMNDVELNDIKLNDVDLNNSNDELNNHRNDHLDNNLVNNVDDYVNRKVEMSLDNGPSNDQNTLLSKSKRNSSAFNDTAMHQNDSLNTQNSLASSYVSSITNSLTSSNFNHNSTLTTNSTLSSSTTTSAINSINSMPCSTMTRNESVLNLENLNSETNILVNNILKKGILNCWQQSKFNKGTLSSSCSTNSLKSNAKRIFSFSLGTVKLRSWKSRYFMLTENYLLCFKKGSKSDFLSKMGKFQFKLNLLDDIRTINLNETTSHGKSYSIDINDGMMFLFDKDYNLLKEWYNLLVKARQRCEMLKQEQEIIFRKKKREEQHKEIRKEILSEKIERRKLIVSSNGVKRESLLDKFSEKYQIDKSLHSSAGKLSSERSSNDQKSEDDSAFEYLNNLKQRLSMATSSSVTELNRSHSNLAQLKTNTPIINNRKRMSLQRKSFLSQFDSFLGSPLSHSSSKQQIHHQPQDNIVNLANLVNLTAVASGNNLNNENQKLIIESIESPTLLPRIAPQCQGRQNQQANGQQNGKQLTNSCSVFHLGANNVPHNSPFTINNSPALTQRSLYAEQILSNSSLTLSNLSKFPNSRHSTLNSGTSFSQSLFKPFRESIHYATSLRKDNQESKSHLKSATSEFSFIRLTNNSSNSSTLTKRLNQTTDDDTLKRNNRNLRSNFNRVHSFANDCIETNDHLDSEQDLSTASTTDNYNGDTLRNSKTITNLNSELSNRTSMLNPSDIGVGHLNNHLNGTSLTENNNLINHNLINNQANHHHKHNYQKLKKINNSLDESDSTFSSNSSSCSSSNYRSIVDQHQRQSARIDQVENLKHNTRDILSYSPNHSPRLFNSPRLNNSPNLNQSSMIKNSPLINQNRKLKVSKFNDQTDHTYQKVNSNKRISNNTKQSMNSKITSSNKQPNGNRSKKKSSIPVSNRVFGLNEPIYQSTEKRKSRMNKILENQSKIYVTMSDLK